MQQIRVNVLVEDVKCIEIKHVLREGNVIENYLAKRGVHNHNQFNLVACSLCYSLPSLGGSPWQIFYSGLIICLFSKKIMILALSFACFFFSFSFILVRLVVRIGNVEVK